jgi:Kef-type K+ transport system membrane component KefB
MDSTPTDFAGLVGFFLEFINLGITFIFAIAFLVVLWKMIDSWLIHADDPSKREEGTTMALTAVIVMIVMVSIWGILALLTGNN